ncbi:MAG: MCE family protein, partial [Pseudonocardia sp.]|nr:MCE family protein [Pseudonocardia sp.]
MTPTTTRGNLGRWVKRGFVTLVAALVTTALVIGIPRWTGDDKAHVVGLFADASTLNVGNVVRAGGVEVGTVRAIGLQDGHARVELEVDR